MPGWGQDLRSRALRAALAAVALAASERTVNGVTLAKTGRYSRGTAFRIDSPWRHLISALSDKQPDPRGSAPRRSR